MAVVTATTFKFLILSLLGASTHPFNRFWDLKKWSKDMNLKFIVVRFLIVKLFRTYCARYLSVAPNVSLTTTLVQVTVPDVQPTSTRVHLTMDYARWAAHDYPT